MSVAIRPYEISVWTLQDSFIAILKDSRLNNKVFLEAPEINIKNDGTQELTFSVPMYYRENGELVENPLWWDIKDGLLTANLRKLKVIFHKGESEKEEIYEFVIDNISETHSGGKLQYELTATGLAFQELGKRGYKISLNQFTFENEYNKWLETKEGKEPIPSLNFWADRIFENSNWTYSVQMDWSYIDGIIGERDEEVRQPNKIYEEEYTTSWEEQGGQLVPTGMEPFKEKARIVEIDKSNIYNATQTLAETFGVYCKYKYHYDSNYHIIKRECIFYNSFLNDKEKIDINYPYDAKSIKREVDSADVITKLFVTPIESESAPGGLITIADVPANKSGEDYILIFDYLYSIGTISEEQYQEIKEYEKNMFLINSQLRPIEQEISKLEVDLIKYRSEETLAINAQGLAKEQMEQSLALLESLSSGTGVLEKTTSNPYRAILTPSETDLDGKQLYYIKISQEGVLLEHIRVEEGVEVTIPLKIWYRPIPKDEGQDISENEEQDTSENDVLYIPYNDENYEVDIDGNGNIIGLKKIKLMEDSINSVYYLTFCYQPSLHYENVYKTFLNVLRQNETKEKNAKENIEKIKLEIQEKQEQYQRLLEKKKRDIASFENLMGPAIREGSWQAEELKDYGTKRNVTIPSKESSFDELSFIWDTKPFDGEQLATYDIMTEEGVETKNYYCVELKAGVVEKLVGENKIDKLSFLYKIEPEQNIYQQMNIGAELQYAYLREKPNLLTPNKDFEDWSPIPIDKGPTLEKDGTGLSSIVFDKTNNNGFYKYYVSPTQQLPTDYKNKTFCFSFEVWVNEEIDFTKYDSNHLALGAQMRLYEKEEDRDKTLTDEGRKMYKLLGEFSNRSNTKFKTEEPLTPGKWIKAYIPFTMTDEDFQKQSSFSGSLDSCGFFSIALYSYTYLFENEVFKIRAVKLETGNTPSQWTEKYESDFDTASSVSYSPVVLLTDLKFDLDRDGTDCKLGIISASFNGNEVNVEIEDLDSKLNFIYNYEIVYPRFKIDSLLLKTSEDELIISKKVVEKTETAEEEEATVSEFEKLKNFYDYSILIRDNSYFITLKNQILLEGNIEFKVSYSLSNAALHLYLDALEVSKTNAFPKTTYEVEISAFNRDFISQSYNYLNRVISINDADLKFNDVQGYISEISLKLNTPWEDSFVVQNYRNKFEDLFSSIVASTEAMKSNSYVYGMAAGAFLPNGTLKPSIIQNAISDINLTYAFQNGNLTIDEENGIWATSDDGVVAMRGGGIFCSNRTDSYGNRIWNTGILPSGINASLITAGQLDTNLIKVYAGDNLRFQLNGDGLFAYGTKDGNTDFNQYVVHNSEGLFSTIKKDNGQETHLVEVSWNGFILRDKDGNTVFNADKTGNLSIVGTVTAAAGSIGGWEIQQDGLRSKNNNAGLISTPSSNQGTNPDEVFWVNGLGTNNTFKVTEDGTMYANNVIVKGFISGATSSEELDGQLRAISFTVLQGTTFTFDNSNYDGNLVISPEHLYFRINTNALTDAELTNSKYRFYYRLEEETHWNEINLDLNESPISFDPNYLTLIVKSDIMYLGLGNASKPNSVIYLKVEKAGKTREKKIDSNEFNYTRHTYSAEIQLVSQLNGIGKMVSEVSPQSHTFIFGEDSDDSEQKFSVTLEGFNIETDREELENSTWLINGEDLGLRTSLYYEDIMFQGENEPDALVLDENENIFICSATRDTKEIVIGGETAENASPLKDSSDFAFIGMEDLKNGKIEAFIQVKPGIINGDSGSIVLTFKIGSAQRTSHYFKSKTGADGADATLIVLRSTSGTTLVAEDTETNLSVEVYYGKDLMNVDENSNFYYVWKKDGESLTSLKPSKGTEAISATDGEGKINENFFKLKEIYVNASNFGLKAIYDCYVFTTLDEAVNELGGGE